MVAGQQPGHAGGAVRAAQWKVSEIFLSYAGADRARVEPLVHALEAEGLQLWWDRDINYGESFHKVIEQALTAAPCVVVVWTRESVQSEWVLNEASDARKRDRLVPVLLDPVTPPLEFRHLQAADLSHWKGDAADPQFTRLREGLVAMLGRNDARVPAALATGPVRKWWQTWPGQAAGAGGLMIGVSVLIFTMRQVGMIGPPLQSSVIHAPGGNVGERVPDAQSGQATAQNILPPAPAASSTERVNLLDTEAGARLLSTNKYQEQYWNLIFNPIPAVAPGIVINGFAILAMRGDKTVTFDTLAIFVGEAYAPVGVKDLAIFTSVTSPEGPFVKAAQITVPNHFVVHQPFQEFHFPPVQARFVKLQVLSSHASGVTAYVGSIQLYASNTGSRF